MASSSLSTYNSSLATDPLRTFRFTASFQKTADGEVFNQRIVDTVNTSTPPKKGVSTGWVGGFSSISGLQINTQSIPYREGGYNTTVHQIPGMTTFVPITFSRGVLYGNDQAMSWMRGVFAAAAGEGLNAGSAANRNFRVNITITVNDHPNTDLSKDYPKLTYKIHNAFITNINYSDLDATNGAILFETIQVVHEGISVYFTDAAGNAVDPSIQSK